MKTANDRIDFAIITDLKDGSQIRASRRVIHLETHAVFPEGMTLLQIIDYLRSLRMIEQKAKIYRSDALKFCNKNFGQDHLVEVTQQLEFDIVDLEHAGLVSQVPPEARRPGLGFDHYLVMGRMAAEGKLTEEAMSTWATVAREESLSAQELDSSISAGRVTRKAALPDGAQASNRTAMITIQAIATAFRRWTIQMEERGSSLKKLSAEQRRAIYEELRPIREFVAELERDLNGAA